MTNDVSDTPSGREIKPLREGKLPYTKRFARPDGTSEEEPEPQRARLLQPDGISLDDILKDESPEKLQALMQLVVRGEYSNGPYPPPSFVEGYEKAAPGMGREVLQAGIDRVRASTQMDIDDGNARRSIDMRGQIFAFSCVLVIVGAATLWVYWGNATEGAWIVGAVVVLLVVAFIGSSQIKDIAKSFWPRRGEDATALPPGELES